MLRLHPRPPSLALAGPLVAVLLAAGVARAVVVENGTDARFIRVRNDGTASRPLHIGEIEAFLENVTPTGAPDNANDVALDTAGASFESAVGTGGHGSTAAVYNGLLETGASTWTRGAVSAEYVLDLGQTRSLGNVRVWQRADGCCQERLSDFTVSLLEDDGSGLPGAVAFSESWAGNAPYNSYAPFDTRESVEILPGGAGAIGTETLGPPGARFIRVKNNGTVSRPLHIGEIEGFLQGVTPAAGVDNANDVALDTAGASFESEVGSVMHGSTAAVYDGALQTGGATWSRSGVGAEYVLDLGQVRDLGTVRVWQRADGCCQDRLSDFTVSLLGDNGAGGLGDVLFSESFPGVAPTNSFASFSFSSLPAQYTILDIGLLSIELESDTGAADLLSVGPSGGGDLTINPGATLDVTSLSGSFLPGQSFDILDFGTVTGEFTTLSLPALAYPLHWGLNDLYTTGVISVNAPEPSAIGLFGLGLVGLALRRRRRTTRR